MGSLPVNLPVIVVDMQEVNAATDGRSIFVTYGLLSFADSDDEIACVIAHELAHAVLCHENYHNQTHKPGNVFYAF